MNFFEHQDRARRKTGMLVWLFVVAVIGLIAGTYVLIMSLYLGGLEQASQQREMLINQFGPDTFWRPDILIGVALAVFLVVGGGSLYKTAQLSGGGEPLALSLGGRRLLNDSSDPVERKVLNVVEEMALASGLPVPPVFMMDREQGINAFAAGYQPEDAVIGVTRGCVENLSRDELQGVIAHEFSHILNGDMRLNIRLIGIVHGILLVGLIGYYTLRIAAASGGRRRSNDKGGGGLAFLGLGLGLMAIGFVGTLIGNLIKAAVSRQREFLADASAVQFTRDPNGIAGALKKIGGLNTGSKVTAAKATEASHMFFATGVAELFATHPPLEKRIARIDMFWQAEMQVENAARSGVRSSTSPTAFAPAGAAGFAGSTASLPPPSDTLTPRPEVQSAPSPEQAVEAIGKPTPQQIARSHELLESLPETLREAAREPYGARGVIYALLLDADFASCQRQFEQLAAEADPAVYRSTTQLHKLTEALPRESRLPLVDICLGPLKDLSPEQYERFRENMHALVAADNRLSLFEWTLQKVVLHVLDPHFGRKRKRKTSGRPAPEDVSTVLSALAHAGSRDQDLIQSAFERGVEATGLPPLELQPWDRTIFSRLNHSLDALGRLPGKSKAKLIRGLAETASADGTITSQEINLLRAIATTLDCPMPLIA
jgi:Zn-dependent protease with chaperone function